MPNLAMVVCGAPLARRSADLAVSLTGASWDVSIVATPAARPWLDDGHVLRITGHRPQSEFRPPDQAKRGPAPDAVLVCPATFNTVNKMAGGIADNYALGVIGEALGVGIPVVAVPMISDKLWGHFRLARSLADLEGAGVRFVDARTGARQLAAVPSGSGEAVTAEFQTGWVLAALASPT